MAKETHTPKTGWAVMDIAFVILTSVATVTMMVISTINLNAILVSSNEVVFIEEPYKAWLISLLAPLSGLGFKFLQMAFEYPQNVKRYIKGLYILTSLVTVLWLVLIARQFGDSMGGGFALDDLLTAESVSSALYTFTQLTMEILLSASMFTACQSIFDKYKLPKPNPNARLLDKKIAYLVPIIAKQSEAVQEALREVEAIKNHRDVFVNEQLQSLALLKAKVNFNNTLFGE